MGVSAVDFAILSRQLSLSHWVNDESNKNKVLHLLQQGFILIELLLQEAITDEEIKHG
jgi:hypothetical protein